jgi:hypothetical protein
MFGPAGIVASSDLGIESVDAAIAHDPKSNADGTSMGIKVCDPIPSPSSISLLFFREARAGIQHSRFISASLGRAFLQRHSFPRLTSTSSQAI